MLLSRPPNSLGVDSGSGMGHGASVGHQRGGVPAMVRTPAF